VKKNKGGASLKLFPKTGSRVEKKRDSKELLEGGGGGWVGGNLVKCDRANPGAKFETTCGFGGGLPGEA